jgi:hypothetical protein
MKRLVILLALLPVSVNARDLTPYDEGRLEGGGTCFRARPYAFEDPAKDAEWIRGFKVGDRIHHWTKKNASSCNIRTKE